MLTFSEVGNTEAHETKRRTSQPDSGLATIPTRRFWPCIIVGGMDTNMGDLHSFCHEVFPSEDWKAGTIEGFGFPYPDSSSTPLSQPNPAACLLGSTVFSRARASIEPQRLKIEGRERQRTIIGRLRVRQSLPNRPSSSSSSLTAQGRLGSGTCDSGRCRGLAHTD
jgi:hypothetical protein